MEAPCSKQFLQRAIDQLLLLYDTCEEKKRQCELVCKDCRKLLKPWPRKKRQSVDSNKTDSNSAEKVTHGDPIPDHEVKELELVNQLLTKAQKSRKRAENKVQRETQELTAQNDLQTETTDVPQATAEENETSPPTTTSKPPLGRVQTDKIVVGTAPRGVRVVSSTKVQKGCTSIRQSSGSITNQVKDRGSVSNLRTKPNVGIVKKSTLDKVLKPVSSNHSGSASRKPLPAHAKAPFKTDVKRPLSAKRVTTRARSCDRPGVKPNSAPVPDRSRGGRQMPQQKVGKTTNLVKTSSDSELASKHSVKGVVKTDPPSNDVGDILNKDEHQQQSNTQTDCGVVCKEGRSNVDKASENGDIDINNEAESDMPFLLLRDGRKLTIPAKLRRMYMNNVRLREKVKTTRLTHRVGSQNRAEHFMSKIQAHFDKENPDHSLFNKVSKISAEYKSLMAMWDNLRLDMDEDMCSARDVLLMKRTLEFIVIECNNLEQEYHWILRETAGHTTAIVGPSTRKPCDLIWLPDWIDSATLSHIPKGRVKYTNLKQLSHFITTTHNIQVGLHQAYFLDTVAQELLPYLKEASVDSKFVGLYRTAYGILCSGGQLFPAMVSGDQD